MRILYCATDQRVPGTLGGSTHVVAVAEGLARLGHEVHALVGRGDGPFPDGAVRWHAIGAPLGRAQLRVLRAAAVRRLAETTRPDLVMERYHNFGGEGALAARAVRVPLVLEVNAPAVDHPGSRKAWLDRALVVRPFRRWREWQLDQARLVVTPSAAILPSQLPRARVLELEWGADTERFTPGAAGRVPFTKEPETIVAVFAGAFRAWHGAIQLVEAVQQLHARGLEAFRAVFLGDGPERPAAHAAAGGDQRFVFPGAVAHGDMPAALAAADIGVAPFDVARHPPLALAFYWSPLKVFEYMASGLPVVAPALPRLRELVADGVEGRLYEPATPHALADALADLTDRSLRERLGSAGRARAVRDYSWDAHCRALDRAFRELR
jgi:glycosyltransferase involved in cell wall biosynthesis